MRVLLYNDYGGPVGGAEVYVQSLIELLETAGHEVACFAYAEDKSDPFLRHHYSKFRHQFLPYPPVRQKFRGMIESFDPDVIHLHNNLLFTTTVLEVTKKYPTVQTVHDQYQFWPPNAPTEGSVLKRIIKRRRNRKIAHSVNHFICHSTYIHKMLLQYLDSGIATHIPMLLEIDKWRQYRNVNKSHALVFAGRIETYKGVFVLLDAYELLLPHYPTLRLKYYGDGPELTRLKKRAAQIKGGHIQINGRVDQLTLMEGVSDSLIAVVPSIWEEPFGLSGIEAQACNTAVVASAVGGIREWCVDGVTGLCAEPENAEDLATKIGLLLDDNQLREQMLAEAQNHLDLHFSRQNHYIKLVRVYNDLLNEK